MPGNEEPTLQQVMKDAVRNGLLDVHTSLPARIVAYDSSTQKADIKPLLKKKYKGVNGGERELPVITNVPVQWPATSAGGAFIHMPLKKGDEGIAIFCERSLDKYLSSKGEIVSPEDNRTHDISDAFFIPGTKPFPIALQNVNDTDIIIQNEAFRIEISPDGKISLTGKGGQELLTVIESLITDLINARVVSGFGAAPFTEATIVTLQEDKDDLLELKK